jgi:hypothetical protein
MYKIKKSITAAALILLMFAGTVQAQTPWNTNPSEIIPYIASNGKTVWNRTENSGYNNDILGIGRDDASGLYQKQSKNENTLFNVYSGNNITPLNSRNEGTLADGAYAIFGRSGSTASIVQYQHDAIEFANSAALTADDKVSYRAGQMYKAQLTGAPLKVNLALTSVRYDYCLVSANPDFPAGTTRLYKVNDDGKVTIELTDTYSYIDFSGYANYSQGGPGGVNKGLRLWLRADDPSGLTYVNTTLDYYTTANSIAWQNREDKFSNVQAAVSEWRDFVNVPARTKNPTGTIYKAKSNAAFKKPVYLPSHPLTNYHPTIDFYSTWDDSGTGYSAALTTSKNETPVNKAKPVYTKIFMMVNSAVGANCYPFGFHEKETVDTGVENYDQYRPAFGFTAANGDLGVQGLSRLNGYFAFGSREFEPGSTVIASYELKNPPTGLTYYYAPRENLLYSFNMQTSINSNKDGSRTSGNGVGPWHMEKYNSIGSQGWRHNRSLRGFISEIIMYADDESSAYSDANALTQQENDRIHSYYAMKYGVTLRPNDLTGTGYNNRFNYTLSNNTPVWTGQSNSAGDKYVAFYHNLAAVVRDDASMLNNRQTHSTETGSILHLGVAGKYLDYDGESNTGELNNGEAVMFGDNRASGITAVQDAACGEFSHIFNRKWMLHKVQDAEKKRALPLMFGLQNNLGNNLAGFAPADSVYYNTLLTSNEFFMIVANSREELEAETYRAVVPMTWENREPQCTYTLTEEDEFVYLTFAYREAGSTGCDGDESKAFEGKRTFYWTQWSRQDYGNTANQTLSKGEYVLDNVADVKVTGTSVKFDNVTATSNSPSLINTMTSGSIYVWRAISAANQNVTITIDFNTPVIPEFVMGALDGYRGAMEQISVTGKCDGEDVVYPSLSYRGNPKNSSYTISANTITARWQGNALHDDLNTQVNVAFQGGVKRIIITYRITGTPTRDEAFLIGPVSIRMAPLAPPVNEDGLSFVKSVKESNLTTCQPVEYSFHIGNVNCVNKTVLFTDTLPAGLKWNETVGLDGKSEALNPNLQAVITQTTDGSQRDVLKIENLVVPESSALVLTATAAITGSAVPENTTQSFSNRAMLNYEQIVGVPMPRSLPSKDRYSLDDYTVFNAEWVTKDYVIKMKTEQVKPEIYRENNEVTVTLTLENPNTVSLTDMYLEINYDAGFTYKANTYSGANGQVVNGSSNGLLSIAGTTNGLSGFTLPVGETVFTFTLKAPDRTGLLNVTDNDGNPVIPKVIASLNVTYGFVSEMNDPCVLESLNDLSGTIQIPYKKAPTHILVNKHITSKILK